MKNLRFLGAVIIVLLIFSCTDQLLTETNTELVQQPKIDNALFSRESNKVIRSDNELIIQFKENVSESIKDSLRRTHEVIRFQICGDNELWEFNGISDINDKKGAIKNDDDEDDVEEYIKGVSFQYSFYMGNVSGGINPNSTNNFDFESLITANTSESVVIAVLDTGIDPHLPAFQGKLPLHNTGQTAGSGFKHAGFDFIDLDYLPQDDFITMHGTVVTYFIYKVLESTDVSYQIMPIKIADSNGKVKSFNTICGFQYAAQNGANIINMSFGRTGNPNEILEDVIKQYSSITVVSSAGNNNLDNYATPHYPSSYDSDNIIGIAASNANKTDSSDFTNYGDSVHFFAPGEYTYFPTIYGPAYVSGTSFATPVVSGKTAIYLFGKGKKAFPTDVVNHFLNTGRSVRFTKHVKHSKIIE